MSFRSKDKDNPYGQALGLSKHEVEDISDKTKYWPSLLKWIFWLVDGPSIKFGVPKTVKLYTLEIKIFRLIRINVTVRIVMSLTENKDKI